MGPPMDETKCHKEQDNETTQYIKATVPVENIFIIICFYAFMHRTTIVQNKIINIICSFLFLSGLYL